MHEWSTWLGSKEGANDGVLVGPVGFVDGLLEGFLLGDTVGLADKEGFEVEIGETEGIGEFSGENVGFWEGGMLSVGASLRAISWYLGCR